MKSIQTEETANQIEPSSKRSKFEFGRERRGGGWLCSKFG